jgi:putative transposase
LSPGACASTSPKIAVVVIGRGASADMLSRVKKTRRRASVGLPGIAEAWPHPTQAHGRRKNAGRKPNGDGPGISHRPRELLRSGWAVHVTLRVLDHVWNLRSRRCFSAIESALAAARERFGMRIVHFSVQGNHVHLLIEAPHNEALARGMQGLTIRMAKALNRVMGRRGPVFADHYHSRVVRTPTEAARVLNYVLRNHAHHAKQWGETVGDDEIDPFSSVRRVGTTAAPVSEPQTWLLNVGWLRAA